jgi:hypothetical protein
MYPHDTPFVSFVKRFFVPTGQHLIMVFAYRYYTAKKSNPKKSFDSSGLQRLSLQDGIQEADGRYRVGIDSVVPRRLATSSISFSSTKDNAWLGD